MLLWHFFGLFITFILQPSVGNSREYAARRFFHPKHTHGHFNSTETALECPQRQCRLAILCWLDGGNANQGCGYNSWLYSCCMKGPPSLLPPPAPPKFALQQQQQQQLAKRKRQDERQLQKKFQRRRYDTSETHLVPPPNCGVPRTPSNTLQKRIIGGRPAYFAGELAATRFFSNLFMSLSY
jgi:hypothetical protein